VTPNAINGPPGVNPGYLAALSRPAWKPPVNAESFFGMYFFATSLHAVHVVLAASVLALIVAQHLRRTGTDMLRAPMALSAVLWLWITATGLMIYPVIYLWA
jgi:cytochrome c oxidase subunit 3